MKKLKGIFFDFDGTLVDSLDLMFNAYEQFLTNFNLKPSFDEFTDFNGPPIKKVIELIKEKYHLKNDIDYLVSMYDEIIDDLYLNAQPNIDSLDFIDYAYSKSLLIAIVSSNSKKRINNWLSKFNIYDKISFTVSSDDVKYGKPNSEPYLNALKLSKFNSNEVIAIEDSVQGAISASNAQIRTFILSGRHIETNKFLKIENF